MKKITLLLLVAMLLAAPRQGNAFCGFYVAKADVKLFNKGSQVIFVRDGNKSVVTMSNDFRGDVKDFAMVVPVPTVLKRNDIKIADRYIFDKLDAYSGPRLVEYYDQNPCYKYKEMYSRQTMSAVPATTMADMVVEEEAEELGVTIEAQYTVGEYDILILSAEESGGLKTWLTRNGYKIPKDAEEVLDPYIKSDLKFFVAKVNLKEKQHTGSEYLRPIQISYESNKYMLPIRLGMANADEAQDLIIYSFTKKGRVECTNYRTVEVPTNKEIPTFVKDQFSPFYKDLFEKAYKRNKRNAVFLEYSWDLSSSNYVKCDPCATTPPTYAELKDAGIFWAEQNFNGGWGSSDYQADVFMTRLHVKYDRENFPQDLFFQNTPNTENFQGRYIMNHPVQGHLDCEASVKYYRDVLDRRENELDNLAYLTGWDTEEYNYYIETYENRYKRSKDRNDKGFILPAVQFPKGGDGNDGLLILITILSIIGMSYYLISRNFRLA